MIYGALVGLGASAGAAQVPGSLPNPALENRIPTMRTSGCEPRARRPQARRLHPRLGQSV